MHKRVGAHLATTHNAELRKPDSKVRSRRRPTPIRPLFDDAPGPSASGKNQRDSVGEADSARLFVRLVLAAVRAELLDLETIGIVTTVLLGDVVAVLAHLAGQGDLWPDVS